MRRTRAHPRASELAFEKMRTRSQTQTSIERASLACDSSREWRWDWTFSRCLVATGWIYHRSKKMDVDSLRSDTSRGQSSARTFNLFSVQTPAKTIAQTTDVVKVPMSCSPSLLRPWGQKNEKKQGPASQWCVLELRKGFDTYSVTSSVPYLSYSIHPILL